MKKWDYKKIICAALFILGVIGVGYAIHAKHRIAAANTDIDTAEGFFKNNPVSKFFSGRLHAKTSEYAKQANILLTVGIIFVVVGGVGFFYFLRKKR